MTSPTDRAEEIKPIIRDAFKDVTKAGIGVREAIAIDDYVDQQGQEAARRADVETHWWEILDEFGSALSDTLSFTDTEGFRFLLPALMTASLDGADNDPGHAVWFHLSLWNQVSNESPPHHGHPPYIDYLSRISARQNADHFSLNEAQIRAVAIFLDWYWQREGGLIYMARTTQLKLATSGNESSKQYAAPGHYTLSVADEMAVYDTECRILKDWLELGGVASASPVDAADR